MDNTNLTTQNEKLREVGLELKYTEDGLTLTDGKLSIMVDFKDMLPRLKQSNLQNEMQVKAARIKGQPMPQKIIDATAGFGEDSLILAAAGFEVDLYEFDDIIALLLDDGLDRAKNIPELAPIVARMHFHHADSIQAMQNLDYLPDSILLDPMFPSRSKSAMIKKKFQLLQQLELPCSNENELLDAAMAAHPHKIVIKRPVKGPYLAGIKPAYSISGKAVRYDCLLLT